VRKNSDLKQIRMFLLLSLVLSLLLPLSPIRINIPIFESLHSVNPIKMLNISNIAEDQSPLIRHKQISIQQIVLFAYLLISISFIARFIFSLGKVFSYYTISEKYRNGKFTIVLLDKKVIAFSFFHWIFISKSDENNYSIQIIEHEKVHARQYHSIDIILSEIMVAAIWFNPFIWMFRSAIQQIHEFLADQGVIDSGANPLEYKSLLVNQAAEGKLIAISSNFSYSLIKKRLVMMSEKKKSSHSRIKMLLILPIAALVLMGVSVQKGQSANINSSGSLITNRINDGNDKISRNELIKQGELVLSPDDSEFSQAFKVISFTVSTMIGNFEESYDQNSGPSFTRDQINLIKRSQSGRKVYIENIKVLGLEGEIRNLGSIIFTIK
jgi:beta-lactamase regulating signal transducer with metallopeptidase domain